MYQGWTQGIWTTIDVCPRALGRARCIERHIKGRQGNAACCGARSHYRWTLAGKISGRNFVLAPWTYPLRRSIPRDIYPRLCTVTSSRRHTSLGRSQNSGKKWVILNRPGREGSRKNLTRFLFVQCTNFGSWWVVRVGGAALCTKNVSRCWHWLAKFSRENVVDTGAVIFWMRVGQHTPASSWQWLRVMYRFIHHESIFFYFLFCTAQITNL